MIIYGILISLIAIFYLPVLVYQMIRHKKYRNNLLCRLGLSFPQIDKKGRMLIWIHAVSVGETRAVVKFARSLKEDYPGAIFVISSITETGHAEAKKSIPFADFHVFLPFDFPLIMKSIVRRVKPDLVFIVETDFWFSFLTYAKRFGAKIFLINGKVSEKSAGRYRAFRRLSDKLFSLIDMFCVQNEIYKRRFESIGIPESKIVVTGNLKFDADYPIESNEHLLEWKHTLGIRDNAGSRVITIGSSHDPEESTLINRIKPLWQEIPRLKLLLVPRHPERFDTVAKVLEENHISFIRLSTVEESSGDEQVILVDAMGLLNRCYRISDLAIVAGSFTPSVGGHNILEPSFFGKPVLFGPHMQNQQEMVELVKFYGAGVEVNEYDIYSHIVSLLTDREYYASVSSAAQALVASLGGSVKCTKIALNSNFFQKK